MANGKKVSLVRQGSVPFFDHPQAYYTLAVGLSLFCPFLPIGRRPRHSPEGIPLGLRIKYNRLMGEIVKIIF